MVPFFGKPCIHLTDKDSGFIGSEFAQFCDGRGVTLQMVSPGSQQSLRDTAGRRRYFKDISHQIIDKRRNREVENVDGEEYDPMCIVHMNSQVRQ